MSELNHPMLIAREHLPWWIDATQAQLDPDALEALPWDGAFADLEATEAGEHVNIDEGRAVGHYWLRAPELAPTLQHARAIGDARAAIVAFAEDVRTGRVHNDAGEPFTDLLHVGIGGSQLGPALVTDALASGGLRVHYLDNTDPDGIHRVLTSLGDRLATTLVSIASKSGGTTEPRNALALVWAALRARHLQPESHTVAITVEGSRLHHESASWRARFPLWDWVGGRFSVTSAVGLLPAHLAGVDTDALLDGARAMDAWTRTLDWRDNPAALLAGTWFLAGDGQGRRNLVILPYADRLVLLSRYLQQLVMESLGKRKDRQGRVVHQGLTVYGNKGSTDQHAYVQQLRDGRDDALVCFVQVLQAGGPDPDLDDGVTAGDHLQGFLLGTRRALSAGGRPTLTLTIPEVSAYTLGGLIALFERAVGLYASLIDVNAYDQPGVEAGKQAARAILDLTQQVRAALKNGPATPADLGQTLSADPIELLYVLARLARDGRVLRTGGPLGPYALPD